MRLRYLRVAGLPPLHDVELTFGRNQILERACTIHFVVGVNGSGKTRLLQVLADLFTALAWQRWPSHPLTVAYDLGAGDERRTILIHRPQGSADGRALVEFKTHLSDRSAQEWRALAESDWESDPLPGDVQEAFTGGALPGTGSKEPTPNCLPTPPRNRLSLRPIGSPRPFPKMWRKWRCSRRCCPEDRPGPFSSNPRI